MHERRGVRPFPSSGFRVPSSWLAGEARSKEFARLKAVNWNSAGARLWGRTESAARRARDSGHFLPFAAYSHLVFLRTREEPHFFKCLNIEGVTLGRFGNRKRELRGAQMRPIPASGPLFVSARG